MATSINTPSQSPTEVPQNLRQSLAALSLKVKADDPTFAVKLDAVDKKADVLIGLRELSRLVESGRVTSVTKAEVDAMHDSIEDPALLSTRPLEELAQKTLDAARGMNPEVKKAIIGAGVVGGGILGVLGIRKFFGGAKKAAVKAWDTTLDVGEKAAKTTWSGLKWLFKTAAVAGIGALTFMGIQRAMKVDAPAEAKKTV